MARCASEEPAQPLVEIESTNGQKSTATPRQNKGKSAAQPKTKQTEVSKGKKRKLPDANPAPEAKGKQKEKSIGSTAPGHRAKKTRVSHLEATTSLSTLPSETPAGKSYEVTFGSSGTQASPMSLFA
ncbi:hypothetical protein FA95DRAFT_1573661 [Auriscalpium vulgare]|uniref:Uncharacterized protein n=1 Tax=Auriscalpium vulgare TaxID=40419 RepID=A0ACB8RP10_9AGAM|nr:hypothetical protein FA95DRAFT_1573661 [Auriscalpium vulgare]